jgi:hypothetical protein
MIRSRHAVPLSIARPVNELNSGDAPGKRLHDLPDSPFQIRSSISFLPWQHWFRIARDEGL